VLNPPANIKGLLFDLDGTLIDTRRDLTTGVNLMRAELDLPPLSVESVTSHVGNGARKMLERSLAGINADIDKALARFKHHYAQHLVDETLCYPDVVETLRKLKAAAVKCAVITNKPEAPTRQILHHLGLDAYFDPVIGGDTTPFLKPDPHALLQVAEKWMLQPDELLMVGDNYTDIVAAHRASMKVVFLTSGFGTKGDGEPDYIVRGFRELRPLIGI